MVLRVATVFPRYRWFLANVFVCLSVLCVYLFISSVSLPSYNDEDIYVECGLDYVANLTAPYMCNFEHPPLGKYLIGLLELFGLGRFFFLLLLAGSSILTFVITRYVLESECLAFLVASFLALDTVFINTYRHLLLDPPALFLLLLSLYLTLVKDSPLLSGLFFGLSVACKLSVLPYSLVFLYIMADRGSDCRASLKRLTVFGAVALAAYLSTYAGDLSLGPYSIIRHHVEMLDYMSRRHGFRLPMAVNGLLKLASKVEVWRYGGELLIYFTPLNTSLFTLANSTATLGSGYYLIAGVGLGSVLWYAALPSLLINAYWMLTGRLNWLEVVAVVAGWASLTTILPGPIDWYYVNALPLLYINVALTVSRLARGRSTSVVAASLTLAQALITLLTLAGVVPFEVAVLTQ